MANLRLIRYRVIDPSNIEFTFSENLNSTISMFNVTVVSKTLNVPDAQVLSISINENVLKVTTTPMVPYGVYNAILKTITNHPFQSINGSLLLEDGKNNIISFTAAPNPDNDVLNSLLLYYKNTPYKLTGKSLIRDYLENVSNQLYRANNTIGQVASDNYISILVEDELHQRGNGAYDRFNKEGVYELLKVSPYTNDVVFDGYITESSFPRTPIPLQKVSITDEELIPANSNKAGTFNEINCFLKNNNITKITKIVILYNNTTNYIYNIEEFGYQIQNAKYDENASDYVSLKSNEFRFSEKALKHGFVVPTAADKIIVSYEYKDLGIYIQPDSVNVYKINKSIREVCSPIANVLLLNHANIVNEDGVTLNIGNISFLDPKAIPPYSKTHAAFKNEIIYEPKSLPASPGDYSVDYVSGKVYVYGIDNTSDNIGTGMYPPVCTYYYKQLYSNNNIDYTYEPDLMELAANQEKDLIGQNVIISFKYSKNYVPNVDFIPQIHKEELNERIENRLIGVNTIQPLNAPVTNVFRIFNETTGEIYSINTFFNDRIIFNYNKAPNIVSNKNERASFETISNEILLMQQQLSTSVTNASIWQIDLTNSNIIASSEDCIGSSINTSASFSNNSIFVKELYFDRYLTLNQNIAKITSIGQYIIDYVNGIVYVCVKDSQSPDIGTISYKNKYIQTQNKHIISISDIYTKIDLNSDKVHYSYNTFSDQKIDLINYNFSDNRYVSEEDNIPILTLSDQINLPQNAKLIRGVYEVNDINTNANPINFGQNATVTYSTATLSPTNIFSESTINGNSIIVPEVQNNSKFEIVSINYIKRSDGVELYNTSLHNGSFTDYTITLPTDAPSSSGYNVTISLNIHLKDNSVVIVDADYGGLYVDYTFLYDEIIISYEYGDNLLDFSLSNSVPTGTRYYVTYRYGALRDSLLRNFGSSINIDDFKNFDISLERERYRDALSACLQNFYKGPTIEAISNIGEIVSHIKPTLKESMYDEFVIGSSHLVDNNIVSVGNKLMPSIWNNGSYIDQDGYSIQVPVNNHIKINGGTTEFWVTPNWYGLNENDSILTIKAELNNQPLDKDNIFVGATGYHPTINLDGTFSISKFDSNSPIGIPVQIYGDGYGMFIYYDDSNKNWKVFVKDNT